MGDLSRDMARIASTDAEGNASGHYVRKSDITEIKPGAAPNSAEIVLWNGKTITVTATTSDALVATLDAGGTAPGKPPSSTRDPLAEWIDVDASPERAAVSDLIDPDDEHHHDDFEAILDGALDGARVPAPPRPCLAWPPSQRPTGHSTKP